MGYLMLAQRLFADGASFAEAWNFGPSYEKPWPVDRLVDRIAGAFPGFTWEKDGDIQPHEANYLSLESTKARVRLDWQQKWPVETALDQTIVWYKAWLQGSNLRSISLEQIGEYESQLKVL